MLSVDTNILLYACNRDCDEHTAATAFLVECASRDDVVICELVLVELYQLLRNPAVLARPLDAPDAAEVYPFRRVVDRDVGFGVGAPVSGRLRGRGLARRVLVCPIPTR